MKYKICSNFFLLLIFLLNLFLLVNLHIDEEVALKALSCVTIVTQNFKNGEGEPNYYSPIVLACFMKITEEQAQNVLASIESGNINLSQAEINELTNVESLKDYPEDEIKQKSEILENTMREFQKLDEEYSELKEGREPHYDYDDYDDDYEGFEHNNNKPSKKGIFNLIISGIQGLFNTVGGLWYTIFILIILFLILMLIRKTTDLDNNNKNKNIEKKNGIGKDNEIKEDKENVIDKTKTD